MLFFASKRPIDKYRTHLEEYEIHITVCTGTKISRHSLKQIDFNKTKQLGFWGIGNEHIGNIDTI